MSDGVFASPPHAPHLNQLFGSKSEASALIAKHTANRSPVSLQPSSMSRKRKADDDLDVRMSASPSTSPSLSSQPLPSQRPIKRTRQASAIGRPLSLSRLLETLDADSLRAVLRSVAEAHPTLASEIPKLAPRPGVASALDVLRRYQQALRDAFPFGGDPASDYAFNRVRGHVGALLDALADFTPHFLPPHESSPQTSLTFLDGATHVVHGLPNWASYANNVPKHNAYDEIARAWVAVVQEAAKRAAGISLRYDGWDKKLAKHNEAAGGRLQAALDEMQRVLGWTASGPAAPAGAAHKDERESVRDQLLSGTYGSNVPVRVGPW